jgi:hypothetical protein
MHTHPSGSPAELRNARSRPATAARRIAAADASQTARPVGTITTAEMTTNREWS